MDKRIYIFRGKLSEMNLPHNKGDWAFGDLVRTRDGERIITSIYGYGAVNPDTVGQYTGIKDDCATKAFEGDITEILYDGEIHYGVIEWQPAEARFLIYIKDAADWIPLDDQPLHIVGNIYDNPELLEGAK